MEQETIHLTGYFDRNFGDDMMMKLVVCNLPEITFLVDNTADTPLLSEPNVAAMPWEECRCFPRVVVTGSGFMVNSKAAFITELLKFLKGHHPGDYCLGCNIEHLDSFIKRFLIVAKLNRFKLITCRDRESYKWLIHKTRKPEIHCFPDILFAFPEEWIPRKENPQMLGISLMHRKDDREDCSYYCAMAQVADEWICKTGKGVLLMAFDTGKENDLFACHAVRALMRYPELAEIAAHRDGNEIPAAVARCEKVIGARFHSLVLALRMDIPFFPVIFREKMRNVIKDLNYPICGCAIDSIDRDAISEFLYEKQFRFLLPRSVFSAANEHILQFEQAVKRNRSVM